MRSIFKCPLTSTPLIASIGVQAFTSELRTILLSDGETTPHTEAEDIEITVTFLKEDKRFNHCKIILHDISEGTIIASMVAERKRVKIDALLLHGYAFRLGRCG